VGERTPAKYRKIRHFAKGGMGTVDLVLKREGGFARVYAMKRLHDHFAADGSVRHMFLEEARIAGLLRHANVVSVIDVGEDDGGPFLVMDFVEGIPLSVFLGRAARDEELLPIEIAVDIARQVAEGLRAAHELIGPGGAPARVIHRDVSPTNIILGFDGVARVTDFGIARALGTSEQTRTGRIAGKPGYLAPEQLRFEPVDERTDLYALGVVLFELLATQRLYRGNPADVFDRILGEPPPDIGEVRDDLPPELVELVFELLSKDPDGRPPDAKSVARRLTSIYADTIRASDAVTLVDYLEEHHEAERAEMTDEIARVLEDRDPTVQREGIPDFAEIASLHTAPLGDDVVPPTRVPGGDGTATTVDPALPETRLPETRVRAERGVPDLSDTPVIDRAEPTRERERHTSLPLLLLASALAIGVVVVAFVVTRDGDDDPTSGATSLQPPAVSAVEVSAPVETEREQATVPDAAVTEEIEAARPESEPERPEMRRRRRIAPMMDEQTQMTTNAHTWEWDE
jgi:serine/threonine-protein kinase